MADNNFESFRDMVGERAAQGPLEKICNDTDELACTDLLSLLTVISDERSRSVPSADVIEGNRFHAPSSVPQRLFHLVEGEILDTLSDIDFVELSPLQPFGINTVLAGNSQKNVVSALRRSEANADATTALFRLALTSFNDQAQDYVRLASNTRTTRAQVFDGETKFLPHFKVFAETTVGRQNSSYGARELETLSDHLASELAIIDRISLLQGAHMSKTTVEIGNVLLTQDLIDQELVDECEIRANTANPSYNVLERAGLDIPQSIAMDSPDLPTVLKELGFTKGQRVMSRFQGVLRQRHPELLARAVIDLGRVAGVGYYKHMAYKISAENNDGLALPLSDGGTTEWARNCSGNKQLYTVASGIGTELLCSHFFR